MKIALAAVIVACGACGGPGAPTPVVPASRVVPAAPVTPAPAPATAPAAQEPVTGFAEPAMCPPSPRAQLEACLVAHSDCAREIDPDDHALADLAVVHTNAAVDCSASYVLAADRGSWRAIVKLHERYKHDPTELVPGAIRDERVGATRVTHIYYMLETWSENATEPERESHELKCRWPAVGFPACAE